MSIEELTIYSYVSNQHWILKNYKTDTQDKQSYENYKNTLSKLNKENYFNYCWNLNDSYNFEPDSRKKYIKGNEAGFLDEKSKNIARILDNFMKNWNLQICSSGESYEISRLINSLLTIIRDSLFLNVYNILNKSKLQGVNGFIISYNKDFNLFNYFLKFCHKAFWLPKKVKEYNSEVKPNYIYTVNITDYSGTYGTNLCYFNRCYSATCCCERCTKVLDHLDMNHKDLLSNENLKKLLFNEQSCLMEFFRHNKKYQTLEYKLLKITINGLLLKKYTENVLNLEKGGTNSSYSKINSEVSIPNSEDCSIISANNSMESTVNGLKSPFNQIYLSFNQLDSVSNKLFSSCFVLIKNLEHVFNQPSVDDKNPLNISSLVTDLLTEYTDLWDELSLPIFTFLFNKEEVNNHISHLNELVTHDLKYSCNLKHLSLLSNSRYFKYRTFVSVDIIDENSKLEYFQELLNNCNQDNSNNGDSSNKDNKHENNSNVDPEQNIVVLRPLMRMTKGYSLEEIKILTRLAKCESLKDKCKDFKKEILKYFEKAVSTRPLVDFSTNFGLHPELSTFSNFLNISPLKFVDGKVVSKTGLESLILSQETLEQIDRFLSQRLNKDSKELGNYSIGVVIKGDSGVGKTSLAHCLAQEMGSVFFSVNILNFLRPEVGVSEKIVHSFLSTIRNHFSGSKIGVRKDLVRCVILLEGLESLNGREGYLKRLIFSLCKELEEFRNRFMFSLDSSVMFITTCQRYSNIPERLLKAFNKKIEVNNMKMDEKMVKKCFELFLNMRCDFIDDLDKLIEHIKKRKYLDLLTPLKIATISKDAALNTINELSHLNEDFQHTISEEYQEKLVSLETVISVTNSTFKYILNG